MTIYQRLAATGVPGARIAFTDRGRTKTFPFFTYTVSGGESFADDATYARVPRHRAELHLAEYDEDTIDRFEEVVKSIGPYSIDEEWGEGEVIVSFDFIDGE